MNLREFRSSLVTETDDPQMECGALAWASTARYVDETATFSYDRPVVTTRWSLHYVRNNILTAQLPLALADQLGLACSFVLANLIVLATASVGFEPGKLYLSLATGLFVAFYVARLYPGSD